MRSSEAGAGRRRKQPEAGAGRRQQRRRPEAGAGRRSVCRLRDRGAVTAEAAVVIPVLVAFAMALLWALAAASVQIRCVDAARAGARAAARSEPEAAVLTATRDAAPRGARVAVGRAGEMWRVTVEAPTPGPAALAVTLRAEAAALAEDTAGGAVP
ncbi:TadE family type IV pilus minor pilin [Streptomyces cyaneofuscatus]|uniref:TadE family type IV pilus minor pilin n=1 Tax=Streptomyces cyaneofuscatus TaxID=66883 RepID=UPI0033B93A26